MKQGVLYIQLRRQEGLFQAFCVLLLVAGLGLISVSPIARADLLSLVWLLTWALLAVTWRRQRLRRGDFFQTIPWTLTEDTLTVGDRTFARDGIARVTCRPRPGLRRRGALGPWIFTVEAREGTAEWHSQTDSPRAEEAVRNFQQLTDLLGGTELPTSLF